MATKPFLSGCTPQRWQRCTRIVFLCMVTVALFLPFWFTTQLRAKEQQPDALGAITGVIKDANGQPISGVEVSLWTSPYYQPGSWSTWETVTSEADGSYRFGLLPVGTYRVGAADRQGRYGSRFYPAAPVVQQGNDLLVAGNTITGIDLSLEAGGRILGMINVAAPYSVTNLYAELHQRVETPSGPIWQIIQWTNSIGSSGLFTFTGLAPNSYRICGNGYGLAFSAYECYDNVYAIEKAADLSITSGTTISNVAIVLGDGANYAQIKGRVTATNGQPLANIDIYAFTVVNTGFPQAAAAQGWATFAERSTPVLAANEYYGGLYARTNSTGEYVLSTVPAGQYRLQFVDPLGNYTFEYYADSPIASQATILTVVENQHLTDINAQLDPAGQITGQVTFDGQPAANTNVLAELKLADGSWQAITQTVTNPNTGRYRIGGLTAGSYRISAQATIYDQFAFYQPYGVYGGNSLSEATPITLATGGTAQNIDITLCGPSFTGSMAGRVTSGGTPVAGVRVSLYNSSICCYYYQLPKPIVYTNTDRDGRYSFTGLGNGYFIIAVSDPTGRYATTYYPGQSSPFSISPIIAEDGKAINNLDVTLTVGGAISGHLQWRDGRAVPGLYPVITQYDWQRGQISFPVDVRTDVAGNYTILGLYPGEYTVCFSGQSYPYLYECYGGIDYLYGSYGSQNVIVTAGKTTSGIDLIWGPDLRHYLPIVSKP